MENIIDLNKEITFETFKQQVLEDYKIIVTRVKSKEFIAPTSNLL